MIDKRLWANTTSEPTTSTPVSSGPRWCRLSRARAIASRRDAASPRELMKVRSPHMAVILSCGRGSATAPGHDRFGNMSERHTPHSAQSHDPEYPERLLEFMRTGWRDRALDAAPVAQVGQLAKRRAALSEAFPGETLIIPTGREKVRANDTLYPFRPGSDFAYLTGAHDPDAVLVLRPGGEGTLYLRPRSPRDTDEFFRDRMYGELWIGRRHTLAERAAELGIDTAHLDRLPEALDDCAPGRTRVLRGYDPVVDAAVRGNPERDAELARELSELRLVKDDWEIEQLRDAIDATVRGFEDVARILPADRPVAERLLDGVFGLRARHDGNQVGYSSIVGAGSHATTLHWIRNEGHTQPGELLLMDMGVE